MYIIFNLHITNAYIRLLLFYLLDTYEVDLHHRSLGLQYCHYADDAIVYKEPPSQYDNHKSNITPNFYNVEHKENCWNVESVKFKWRLDKVKHEENCWNVKSIKFKH